MATSLEHLPIELLERIISKLDLETIKSLRAVSKHIGAKSAGPRFCSFLAVQRLDFTTQNVNKLASLASHSSFKYAVTTMDVVEIVYETTVVEEHLQEMKRRVERSKEDGYRDDPEAGKEQKEDEENLVWLKNQISAAQSRSRLEKVSSLVQILKNFPRLSALRIDCAVCQKKDVLSPPSTTKRALKVFERAKYIFETVLAAVIGSDKALDSLSLCYRTQECSIPVVDMTSDLDLLAPSWRNTSNMSSIKVLSISISTKVEDDRTVWGSYHPLSYRDATYEASDDSFRGFIELLSMMSSLEELNIHMFNFYTEEQPMDYEGLLALMSKELRYPQLKRCSFQGMKTTDQALSDWLSAHTGLEYLELARVRLQEGPEGSWSPILQQITSMPKLQTLRLSDLRGHRWSGQLLLEGEKLSKTDENVFTVFGPRHGFIQHTREFSRSEFQGGLRFARVASGRWRDSGSYRLWRLNQRGRYGN